MPFGMRPRNPERFVQVTGEERWPVEVEMPAEGERVWVELVDQNTVEGRVTGWDKTQLMIRVTPGVRARPRWDKITRVVFLDRPRG